jgi:hypothetical protein
MTKELVVLFEHWVFNHMGIINHMKFDIVYPRFGL